MKAISKNSGRQAVPVGGLPPATVQSWWEVCEQESYWYDTTIDAAGFFALEHIAPVQAAMVLCRFNPHNETESDAEKCTTDCTSPDDFKRLRLTFVTIDQTRPVHRSLLDWMRLADESGRKFHPWAWRYAAQRFGVYGPPGPSPQQAVPAVTSSQVADRVSNGQKFKKAALIAQHVHEWPTISRDIADARTNGLAAAAKAGARGWLESAALKWARANGKLKRSAEPADALQQAVHNLASLPSRRHIL